MHVSSDRSLLLFCTDKVDDELILDVLPVGDGGIMYDSICKVKSVTSRLFT